MQLSDVHPSLCPKAAWQSRLHGRAGCMAELLHPWCPQRPACAGVLPELMTKPLTLRNVSKLPLTFGLKAGPPFTLDRHELSLEPFEYATVNVTFDPNPFRDLSSTHAKQKLQVRCVGMCGGDVGLPACPPCEGVWRGTAKVRACARPFSRAHELNLQHPPACNLADHVRGQSAARSD